MNNTSANTNTSQTITPNTLNAITGTFNNTSSNPHQYQPIHQSANNNMHPPSQQGNQENNPAYLTSASNAASTAANGLFLLSQAHQELTKREEAQARAGGSPENAGNNGINGNANSNGRRGTKRKSYDLAAQPTINNITNAGSAGNNGQNQKRTRASTGTSNGRGGRARKSSLTMSEAGMDEDEEEDDDDDGMDDEGMGSHNNHSSGGRRGNKKPETEEEKRKNFLERNRQGLCHPPTVSQI
jgi:ATF/CREB family transcription factor